ncbi:hypothetical protein [Spirilliplanes yamanashiensis]|uniref:Uncharacterized protein n=1 Tax=Spirilliplanes yamanashiensis TaxID=42233 RepID=A0A8J3YEA6_9ACTN|nr:hypothetical protein [Spirilliplanes yamanashiensis]MDP9816619.1 hypothetical protein [Spirilliplanes yamanashiensis]GIJ06145.1 hypothetical protein Sya03_54970 [Spirilliplanes yamanashiensis]
MDAAAPAAVLTGLGLPPEDVPPPARVPAGWRPAGAARPGRAGAVELPGCRSVHRLPDATLATDGADAVLVGDAGDERWRAPGPVGFVHEVVAWAAGGAGRDVRTGALLWSVPGLRPDLFPGRVAGFDERDGILLVADHDELRAR